MGYGLSPRAEAELRATLAADKTGFFEMQTLYDTLLRYRGFARYDEMFITDILVEVNPRHATFYRKVFGFVVAGAETICPRVNAPAVLLRLDLIDLDLRNGLYAGAGAMLAVPALAEEQKAA